jgi:hypothetical protein
MRGKLSTIIIIALTLISLVIFTYGSYQTSELNVQIDDLEKSITAFNNKYDELQIKYNEISVSNEELNQQNIELTKFTIDSDEQNILLREANAILIEENSILAATIIIMQDELNELKAQNITLISDNNLLKEEIKKLNNSPVPTIQVKPETEKVTKPEVNNKVVTPAPEPEKANPPTVTPTGETVYWVRSGTVWHTTQNCSSLQRSTEIFSGTIAESGKERVCSRCP